MSSTRETSFITSPTPSRTRAATRSSSNGATTTSPGALTKWSHPKINCTDPHVPSPPQTHRPFSRNVHASVKLPSISFPPLPFAFQHITILNLKPARTFASSFLYDRTSIVPKFCVKSGSYTCKYAFTFRVRKRQQHGLRVLELRWLNVFARSIKFPLSVLLCCKQMA